MFQFSTARIVGLALASLALSLVVGTPVAGLAFVVAQVFAPLAYSVAFTLVLLGMFLIEGRSETLPLTLVSSRTFIVGTWLLYPAMLWLVTLAVTPQAYEATVAAFSVACAFSILAYRRWKAGTFWPSTDDGKLAKLNEDIRGLFGLFGKPAS